MAVTKKIPIASVMLLLVAFGLLGWIFIFPPELGDLLVLAPVLVLLAVGAFVLGLLSRKSVTGKVAVVVSVLLLLLLYWLFCSSGPATLDPQSSRYP